MPIFFLTENLVCHFFSCSWPQMRSGKWHLSIESDLFKKWHVYFEHAADPMYLRHSRCSLQISCKTSAPDDNTSQRCWTTDQGTLCLTCVMWRNDWKLIKPNVKKSLMPIVFNSWWLLSHSHNVSNKYLLFYSTSSPWILKCFTKP